MLDNAYKARNGRKKTIIRPLIKNIIKYQKKTYNEHDAVGVHF